MSRETFIGSDYGHITKGWISRYSNPGRVKGLPLLQIVQSDSDVNPASYFSVFWDVLRGVNGPGLQAHHSPSSGAAINVELYPCSPYIPSWRVRGLYYFYLLNYEYIFRNQYMIYWTFNWLQTLLQYFRKFDYACSRDWYALLRKFGALNCGYLWVLSW
jgi:hypothetical protein